MMHEKRTTPLRGAPPVNALKHEAIRISRLKDISEFKGTFFRHKYTHTVSFLSISVPGSSITKLKNVTFLVYTKLKMYFLKNANTMATCYNVYIMFYTKKIDSEYTQQFIKVKLTQLLKLIHWSF